VDEGSKPDGQQWEAVLHGLDARDRIALEVMREVFARLPYGQEFRLSDGSVARLGNGNRDAARKAQDGQVYHALNRSVGRMHRMGNDDDFEAFQHDVIETHRPDPSHILSSCVLSNHWRSVVWPEAHGQGTKKRGQAMRANASEWEPGRRDLLETLASDFVQPFPASECRRFAAHSVKWSNRVLGRCLAISLVS
jgi:hypothetical protein